MSEFVVEVRPRSFPAKTFAPTPPSTGDFVAEIRPRAQNYSRTDHNHNLDQDLQTVLADRHFCRESITRLLEGSIVTLITEIVACSRIEGSLCVSLASHESPIIVNLNRSFCSFPGDNKDDVTDSSLEGAFKLKIKNGNVSMPSCPVEDERCPAGSPFHDFERDPCDTMAEIDSKLSFPSEYYRDGEASLSSPPHGFCWSLPSPPRDVVKGCASLPAQSFTSETTLGTARRQESDEESGYTSNDKDDSDAACDSTSNHLTQKPGSTFNDYYCSGFDGKNTLYTSYERQPTLSSPNRKIQTVSLSRDNTYEMDDDEEEDAEFGHRLVIDEHAAQDEISCSGTSCTKDWSQPMDLEMESSPRECIFKKDVSRNVPHRKTGTQDRHTEEAEDLDSPVSSDITDTDVPVDLSGDSKFSSDAVAAVPHPQSLVFKHPGGFMCKQCSHILPDAEAVSSHVQSVHDLHCCTFCCRTFTAKNNLKRHIRIHTGHRPYKCSQCSQTFARRDDLKGHMLRHDYSKPFRCSLCKKGYTDRACVKNHMAKEHRSRLMHVCPQCGESYDQEAAFAAHKKSHPELQQFSCDTCSFIGTNNLMTQKHALLHSHKLFSCKPCNAYFADPFDYTNHVRQHKKLPVFSQYICCFCDLALSTYDQYIRHEYSHAQSKTHTCKTCRKQFKSKSLLQDHVLLHQEPDLDKSAADEMCLDIPEMMEPNPTFWQGKEVTDDKCGSDSMESTFTDDYTNRSSESPIPTGIKMICQSIPEEDERDEGQLLDLSMKKPSSVEDLCHDLSHLSSRPRMTGLTHENFPRNGDVPSESFVLSREHEVCDRSLRAYQSSEADVRTQGNCKSIFQMKDLASKLPRVSNNWSDGSLDDTEVSLSSLGAVNNGKKSYQRVKELFGARPRSVEKMRLVAESQYARSEPRQLLRTVSQDHTLTAPLRFSPYSRKKMADLAAKFVAARGTKLFEQRLPRKYVLPNCENRTQAIIVKEDTDQQKLKSVLTSSRWQLASNQKDGNGFRHESMSLKAESPKENSGLSYRGGNTRDAILREEPNLETILKYHVPTVVKSEPILDHDPSPETAYNLQSSLADNPSNTVSALNMTSRQPASSYVCEDCKEEFGSFSELENHSVELHKRYLCEHCKKSFTARPNRDRHVRYHTGERPYKCDLCDMAFFRGDDLKYHRTTRHPMAMPFICTRCSASFTWGRDLERHIRHSKCKS